MKFLNTLNRVVIVIVCLALMAVLTALFVLPHVVLTDVGQWMVDWGNYLEGQNTWSRFGIGIALAAAADVTLLVVIFLEVRRKRRRYIRVQQVAGGMATISIESVTELLLHRLDPLPGVIKVVPEIQARGKKVDARAEVIVSRGTNVPQAANLLIKEIQTALTDELGMQIAGQPEVRVTVVAQRTRETAVTPPAPKPLPLPEIDEIVEVADETESEAA